MTTDRCPRCAAALPARAQWCTLCFADLRPPAAATPEPPAAAPAPAPPVDDAAAGGAAPSVEAAAAPAAVFRRLPPAPVPGSVALAPDPILDAPLERPAPTWPCVQCGTVVPLDDELCPNCGARFLGGSDTPAIALPMVGDVTRMSTGVKYAFAGVAAVAVFGVLVLLMVVLGHFV